uniref:hypothetical protein n=1 Tax=Oligella urethralis TaxID=90245 RepID=UPI001CA4F10C
VFGNTGFGGLLKETTHRTKVRMQENKLYFRKFEGLLQRSQVVLDLAASKQSQTILLGMDAQQQALRNICEKYFK